MTDIQPETGSRFAKDNDPVFEQLGICHTCKRRRANGISCTAFPEGIPIVILVGDFVHTSPYPGDGGLTYVPVVVWVVPMIALYAWQVLLCSATRQAAGRRKVMTRQASCNSLQAMVMDLRPFLRNIVISFDAEGDEDEDEDEGTGEGNDEGGEGASGAGTGSGDGKAKPEIKDPEKKRLSDEAAAHRVRARAEKERADAAEAELRKLTDKDKSELEKALRDVKETTARAEKAEARVGDLTLRVAFFESGAAALFKDPNDARKLLDFSTLKANDEGDYEPKEVKALADAFLKTKPFYAASEDDGSGSTKDGGGAPQNGRKTKDTDKAALVKKFPALASRG